MTKVEQHIELAELESLKYLLFFSQVKDDNKARRWEACRDHFLKEFQPPPDARS